MHERFSIHLSRDECGRAFVERDERLDFGERNGLLATSHATSAQVERSRRLHLDLLASACHNLYSPVLSGRFRGLHRAVRDQRADRIQATTYHSQSLHHRIRVLTSRRIVRTGFRVHENGRFEYVLTLLPQRIKRCNHLVRRFFSEPGKIYRIRRCRLGISISHDGFRAPPSDDQECHSDLANTSNYIRQHGFVNHIRYLHHSCGLLELSLENQRRVEGNRIQKNFMRVR